MLCMRTLLALSVFVFGITALAQKPAPPSPALRACLGQAQKESTPGRRDRQRAICLDQFTKNSTVKECLELTRFFEYSIHSEDSKKNCLFRKTRQLKADDCIATARALEYGENKDELLWTCLREIPRKQLRNSCLTLARTMVFSPHRDRATSYCFSELDPQ